MADTGANAQATSAPAYFSSGGASGGPLSPAEAKSLIERVNQRHDLQTSFSALPKRDPKADEFWRQFAEAVGNFFEKTAHIFKPLSPYMPYILTLLGLALLALILSPFVRMMITTRFRRLFSRDHLRADATWRPEKANVVALLADIDALSAAGAYDEAVHLLLVRSVADLNAYRPDLVRKHASSRDIASHPLLPVAARPAFYDIVQWVEKSYFAGMAVGETGFIACRKAYTDFIAAEGIA